MVRSIVLVIAAALGVVSISPDAAAQDAVAKGKQLFTDQKCALCHSVAGKGNAKGPLDEVGSKLSAADIRAWITDAQAMTTKAGATRKPPMKQFSLPREEVDALVAYLVTLKK